MGNDAVVYHNANVSFDRIFEDDVTFDKDGFHFDGVVLGVGSMICLFDRVYQRHCYLTKLWLHQSYMSNSVSRRLSPCRAREDFQASDCNAMSTSSGP